MASTKSSLNTWINLSIELLTESSTNASAESWTDLEFWCRQQVFKFEEISADAWLNSESTNLRIVNTSEAKYTADDEKIEDKYSEKKT